MQQGKKTDVKEATTKTLRKQRQTASKTGSSSRRTTTRTRAQPAKHIPVKPSKGDGFARSRSIDEARGRYTDPMGISQEISFALLQPQASDFYVMPDFGAVSDYRRVTGRFVSDDFGQLKVAFEGNVAKYDWGDWLDEVNSGVFQNYFQATQSSQAIELKGVDDSSYASNYWGFVVWQVDSLTYSSRFGGSIHVRLLPIEDVGPEIGHAGDNIYLDLCSFALHLYIQPRNTFFNNPGTVHHSICSAMLAELEYSAYEVYQKSGEGYFFPHPNPDDLAVEALINSACQNAAQRLKSLGLFTLGFVHNKWIPDFESIDETVTNVHLSDNLCKFDTVEKKPYIQIRMEVGYHGTHGLEGWLMGGPELLARPYIALKAQESYRLPNFDNRLEKYLGSGVSTGMLTYGYLSLEEFAVCRFVLVQTSWTEFDSFPNFDDWGHPVLTFSIQNDLEGLQARADDNDLGLVGPVLFDMKQDEEHEFLSYTVKVRFELVKR